MSCKLKLVNSRSYKKVGLNKWCAQSHKLARGNVGGPRITCHLPVEFAYMCYVLFLHTEVQKCTSSRTQLDGQLNENKTVKEVKQRENMPHTYAYKHMHITHTHTPTHIHPHIHPHKCTYHTTHMHTYPPTQMYAHTCIPHTGAGSAWGWCSGVQACRPSTCASRIERGQTDRGKEAWLYLQRIVSV